MCFTVRMNVNSRCCCVFLRSEESYVVLDYATVENVSVQEELSDSKLNLKLLMNPNSDGRSEHMTLVAESR